LVCISGGFDSTALLFLLDDLREEFSLHIYAAHLNHMLRGKESDEDENFVKKLTDNLGIPLTVERKEIRTLAEKEKSSLEEVARDARYKFFFKTAKKNKLQKIAVGHTLDDEAETFLMRILRGSGLNGLSGIWPVREMRGYFIVRPLIEIAKNDVLDYLEYKKVRARLDSSNLSDVYLRNKIRLKLLPFLEREFNPNIKETLVKEADILREIYRFLEKKAERVFKKRANKNKGVVNLNLKNLTNEEISIIDEVLRKSIYHAKGNLNRITFRHILNLNKLIKESTGTATVDLPDNLKVSKEYDKLKFYKERLKKREEFISLPSKLKIPGITDISDLGLKIETKIFPKDKFKPKKDKNIEYIDLDKLKEPTTLRFKKPHDKFRPLGMRKKKKLKEFFIDNKTPKDERDKTVLVLSGGEIIWVVDHRISDTVKITKKTKKVLRLNLVKKT